MKKILPWMPVSLVLLFLVAMFAMDAATKHSPVATCLFLLTCCVAGACLFTLFLVSVMKDIVPKSGELFIPTEFADNEPPLQENTVVATLPQPGELDTADAEALAILGDYLLGSHGEVPAAVPYERRAIQWAYERMQYRHAWVVCSPVADAMEELMQKRDKV